MSIAVVLAAFHLLMRMGYVIGHEMMVEYRAYPSLPWVAILYGGCIIWIPKRVTMKSAVARMCTVAFVVFLALLSVARSTLWSKPSALARDVLRQYPVNNRARAALMRQLLLREQYDAVALEYQEVLKSVAVMSDNIQSTEAVRRYDYDRFIGDWTVAENSYALALVELKGIDAALLHLDRTIKVLSGDIAGNAAEEMDTSLRDLISFRDRLRGFDKAQDGDVSGGITGQHQ